MARRVECQYHQGLMKSFTPKAALFLLLAAILPAQSLEDVLIQKLQLKFAAIESQLGGVLGVTVIDLQENRRFGYHQDIVFPTASLIKVPILIELFRQDTAGEIHLADTVTLQPAEATRETTGLAARVHSGPVRITIRELATLMIQVSDNTATNALISRLGMARINANATNLGLTQTRLQRIMLDSAAAKRNDENISTPSDLALAFAKIYADQPASKEMIDILKGTDEDIRKVIPENIDVASKVGQLPGARGEGAIVFLDKRPFIIVIMSSFLKPEDNPIPAVTAAVFEHFQKLSQSNRYGNRLQ